MVLKDGSKGGDEDDYALLFKDLKITLVVRCVGTEGSIFHFSGLVVCGREIR